MEELMAFFADVQSGGYFSFGRNQSYYGHRFSRAYDEDAEAAWHDHQAKMKAERDAERQRSDRQKIERAQQAMAAAEAERKRSVQEAVQREKEEAKQKHEAEEAEKRRKAAEKRRRRDLQVLGAAGLGRENAATFDTVDSVNRTGVAADSVDATGDACNPATEEVAEQTSTKPKDKHGKQRERRLKEKVQQEQGVQSEQDTLAAAVKLEDTSSASNAFAVLEPADVQEPTSTRRTSRPVKGKGKSAAGSSVEERKPAVNSTSMPAMAAFGDRGQQPVRSKEPEKTVEGRVEVPVREFKEKAVASVMDQAARGDGAELAVAESAGPASAAHPTRPPAQVQESAATSARKSQASPAQEELLPEKQKIEWKMEMERWDASRRLDEQRAKQVQEARSKKEEEKRKEGERRRRAEQLLLEKQGGGNKKGKAKKAAMEADVVGNGKPSEATTAAADKRAKPKVPGLEEEIWDLPQIDKWAKEDSLAWQQLQQERLAMARLMSSGVPEPPTHRARGQQHAPEFHNPLVRTSPGSSRPEWLAHASLGNSQGGGPPSNKNGAAGLQAGISGRQQQAKHSDGSGASQANHPVQSCVSREHGLPMGGGADQGQGHSGVVAFEDAGSVGWTRAEDVEKQGFHRKPQVCQVDVSGSDANHGTGGSPSSPLDIPSAPQSPDTPKILQKALLSALHPNTPQTVHVPVGGGKPVPTLPIYNPMQSSSSSKPNPANALPTTSRTLRTPYRPQGFSAAPSSRQAPTVDTQRLVPFLFPLPVDTDSPTAAPVNPPSRLPGAPPSPSSDVHILTGLLTHGIMPAATATKYPPAAMAKELDPIVVAQQAATGRFEQPPPVVAEPSSSAVCPPDISSVLLPGISLATGSTLAPPAAASVPAVLHTRPGAHEQQQQPVIGLPVMGFPPAVQMGVPVASPYPLPMNGIMFSGHVPLVAPPNTGIALASWQQQLAPSAMGGYLHGGQWSAPVVGGAAEMQRWVSGQQVSESESVGSPGRTDGGVASDFGWAGRNVLAEGRSVGSDSPQGSQEGEGGHNSGGSRSEWGDALGTDLPQADSVYRRIQEGLVAQSESGEGTVMEDLRGARDVHGPGERHVERGGPAGRTQVGSDGLGSYGGVWLADTHGMVRGQAGVSQKGEDILVQDDLGGAGTSEGQPTTSREESLDRWGARLDEQNLYGEQRGASPAANRNVASSRNLREAAPEYIPLGRQNGLQHTGWLQSDGQASQTSSGNKQARELAWGGWEEDARDSDEMQEWLSEAPGGSTREAPGPVQTAAGQAVRHDEPLRQCRNGDGDLERPEWAGWKSNGGGHWGDDAEDLPEWLREVPAGHSALQEAQPEHSRGGNGRSRGPEWERWQSEGGHWGDDRGGGESISEAPLGSRAESAACAPESSARFQGKNSSSVACRHFQRGTCHFGDRCMYSHSILPQQQRTSDRQPPSTHSAPHHQPSQQKHRSPQKHSPGQKLAHSGPRTENRPAQGQDVHLIPGPSQARASSGRHEWVPKQGNGYPEEAMFSDHASHGQGPGMPSHGGHCGAHGGGHKPRWQSRGRGRGAAPRVPEDRKLGRGVPLQ